jgi:KaiC/GvpD/RAD55 family RecA-like ATPase
MASTDLNPIDTLPMSDMKQSAILGHLIVNQRFFLVGNRQIKTNWFKNPYVSKAYGLVLDLYTLIGRQPTLAELKNHPKLCNEDPQIQQNITTAIDKSLSDAGQISLEAIKPELIDWLHSKILFDSMTKGAKLWNSAKFHDAAMILEGAIREYHDAKFEEGVEIRFDDPGTYVPQIETSKGECLTTGLKLLDSALLDGATVGGLQKGDTTVMMAPVNIGKTTSMLTIARHNIMAGKNVLLMTHEGRPDDIRLKLLKSAIDASESEVLAMYRDQEKRDRLYAFSSFIQKYCTYIPYNKAGMTVEDVIPIIRAAQEKRKLETGAGYDLLVVDYPGKLGTEIASKGNLQTRHIVDTVYEVYVQLALEYNFHSLLAIQTNREGSKVNQNRNHDNRLLTMEDVNEAWGPMTSASNVISLNRSPAAQRNNRITYFVAKSRSNEVGQAIVARTNFSHGITHSNEMGAVSYMGTKTLEETIDNYLLNMPGQRIPDDMIRTAK